MGLKKDNWKMELEEESDAAILELYREGEKWFL